MLEKASGCKVNLLLNILGKRPDGFHELETILHPLPLCDHLTFQRAGAGLKLTCSDRLLPVNSKNLVFRAAALFANAAGLGPAEGIRIHLRKHIPVAAGLGGGSGNAAATLLALDELFGHPLPLSTLEQLAASIGSDIPFFLQDRPALATGRGEIIRPLDFFPALRGAVFLLVHPGFGISTPWAYQQLARFPAALHGTPGRAGRLVALLQNGLEAAAAGLYNSLEAPALCKYPLLELFQEFFRQNGAPATLMSGSGSTTFALTPTRAAAETLLDKFKAKFGPAFWTAIVPSQAPSRAAGQPRAWT
jgi:4-diphosphocytidyl-2-C-methyl-D-erythritol kinase